MFRDMDSGRIELRYWKFEPILLFLIPFMSVWSGGALPDDRKNLPKENDRGIPAAYDAEVHGANQHYVAYGAVGSLVVSIEYAEPRYALREGKYELVFKGGVKFSASRIGWIK